MGHGIFGTNLKDNKSAFYRIIQPLRFLKRSGWIARTVPFTGEESISVLPVHDELLMRLSEDCDFILTVAINEEKELLRMMNLRKARNAKWIVDLSENFHADEMLQAYLINIERSLKLADGVAVSNKQLEKLAKIYNDNVYVLPSALDFNLWNRPVHVARGNFRIGYKGNKMDLEKVAPTFGEISQRHKVEFVPIYYEGIIGLWKNMADLRLGMAVMPLEDSGYNRYRDNIDLLELMALKVPLVASPVEAYKGLPILYANNNYEWFECISKVLENKRFREDLRETEHKFVHNNFDMKKLISPFMHWLKNIERKDY